MLVWKRQLKFQCFKNSNIIREVRRHINCHRRAEIKSQSTLLQSLSRQCYWKKAWIYLCSLAYGLNKQAFGGSQSRWMTTLNWKTWKRKRESALELCQEVMTTVVKENKTIGSYDRLRTERTWQLSLKKLVIHEIAIRVTEYDLKIRFHRLMENINIDNLSWTFQKLGTC